MLHELELIGFRNHVLRKVNLNQGVTLVVGQNAIGKSNVLEAIYLLATGESFRAKRIEEMVNWNQEVGHVVGKTGETDLQVTVTKGWVQGRRVQKRLYKINGLGKRKQDFAGLMPAVLFVPEDMDLIGGEPSLRRGFMDEVLKQVDREYHRSLDSYLKGLRQRNRLLDQIREGRMNRAGLYFWDKLLLKEAELIHERRQKLVEQINKVDAGLKKLRLSYLQSKLSPSKLEEHYEAEVAMGHTLSGPHKDDLKVFDDERDLALFGSRGEQRMAVLWLKQAQIVVMEKANGNRPLLLLDDILSELDHHHVEEVVELCKKQQTILTTTDEGLSDYFGEDLSIVRLEDE